jgi:hypothetical protein
MPKAVLQLAWRPKKDGAECVDHELSMAGDDNSLRVYALSDEYLRGPYQQ